MKKKEKLAIMTHILEENPLKLQKEFDTLEVREVTGACVTGLLKLLDPEDPNPYFRTGRDLPRVFNLEQVIQSPNFGTALEWYSGCPRERLSPGLSSLLRAVVADCIEYFVGIASKKQFKKYGAACNLIASHLRKTSKIIPQKYTKEYEYRFDYEVTKPLEQVLNSVIQSQDDDTQVGMLASLFYDEYPLVFSRFIQGRVYGETDVSKYKELQ